MLRCDVYDNINVVYVICMFFQSVLDCIYCMLLSCMHLFIQLALGLLLLLYTKLQIIHSFRRSSVCCSCFYCFFLDRNVFCNGVKILRLSL
jgi:hypothetical protein